MMGRMGVEHGWKPCSGVAHALRAEGAVAGHHQVIDRHEPVPAARNSQGTEGANLRFRGAGSAPAAITDENDAGGPARLGSREDRVCREASCLDPADGEDGRADPRRRSVPRAFVARAVRAGDSRGSAESVA